MSFEPSHHEFLNEAPNQAWTVFWLSFALELGSTSSGFPELARTTPGFPKLVGRSCFFRVELFRIRIYRLENDNFKIILKIKIDCLTQHSSVRGTMRPSRSAFVKTCRQVVARHSVSLLHVTHYRYGGILMKLSPLSILDNFAHFSILRISNVQNLTNSIQTLLADAEVRFLSVEVTHLNLRDNGMTSLGSSV